MECMFSISIAVFFCIYIITQFKINFHNSLGVIKSIILSNKLILNLVILQTLMGKIINESLNSSFLIFDWFIQI